MKVVRAIIGMANRRDGGRVIIGVDDDGATLHPTGVCNTDLQTWTHSNLADQLARFADPSVTFDLAQLEFDGRWFVEVRVREFTDVPILCKDEFNPGPIILRRGACSVRGSRRVETAEVATHEEMRELMDLAIDKGVKRFVERATAAGMHLAYTTDANPSDDALFDRQLVRVCTNTHADRIRSRGHWEVIIRPLTFSARLIPSLSVAEKLVDDARVSLRGWDLPHFDRNVAPLRRLDSVGQDVEWEHHIELWQMYLSGQFFWLGVIPEDWRDQSNWFPASGSWKHSTLLPIMDTLFRLTEIYEFASRLALRGLGSDALHIKITLGGLAGRQLSSDSSRRFGFVNSYTTAADQIPIVDTYSSQDLVARGRDLAVGAAVQVFDRFGWNPSEDHLRSMQDELSR